MPQDNAQAPSDGFVLEPHAGEICSLACHPSFTTTQRQCSGFVFPDICPDVAATVVAGIFVFKIN